MVDNAVYGIIIGVCLALPILVLATGNVITGLLATFSLCCCTVCVVGVIPLGGWTLGVRFVGECTVPQNYSLLLFLYFSFVRVIRLITIRKYASFKFVCTRSYCHLTIITLICIGLKLTMYCDK